MAEKYSKVYLATPEELADLRRRADTINKRARTRVQLKLSVSPELYKRLVELAEQESRPMQGIAIDALTDGLQRYGEFTADHNHASMIKLLPTRAYARDLAAPLTGPHTQVTLSQNTVKEFNGVSAEDADPEYARQQKMQRIIDDLQVPLPGAPPLPFVRELAE